MDFQTFLNMFGGAALAVTGWFARQLWGAVSDLRTDLSRLREELPKTYQTKDDFQAGIRELKELLTRIDNKLDRKVDK